MVVHMPLSDFSPIMRSFMVNGVIYGKESKFPSPDKTRAILPLPSVFIVADAIVTIVMNELVDKRCPPPVGVMFGARKGTQVLDIAHAAQLHMQKGGDSFGIAGLAQGDIATYYDSLSCFRIARSLQDQGLPVFWVWAFLRLQLLPKITLTAGPSVSFVVDARTSGI